MPHYYVLQTEIGIVHSTENSLLHICNYLSYRVFKFMIHPYL